MLLFRVFFYLLIWLFGSCGEGRAQGGHLSARDLFLSDAPSPPVIKTDAAADPAKAGNGCVAAASVAPEMSSRPLSMRYGLLQLKPSGRFSGVNPEKTIFHEGDRVRFSVQINQPAYLSVFQRGSSRNWGVLYPPGSEVAEPLSAFALCEIPAAPAAFSFDGRSGVLSVVLIVSREPLPAATVVSRLERGEFGVEVSDSERSAVEKLKSRDLSFETVEDDKRADFDGTVFYVGRSIANSDDVLSVRLSLRHGSKGDQ